MIAAFVAAFVWAAYSVMSRKLKSVPTDAVAGFCLATALLAALVHALVEATVWPETTAQWLAIAALGVGPVGAAFYAWDIGMKRGDIRVLGAASYATPLLSTAFLILAGFAQAERHHRDRGGADRRRRIDRGQGYDLEAIGLKLSAGVHSFGANSNFAKSNPGATVHPTSVQSPVLSAACQACARHDRLRQFAGGEIGAEPDAALAAVIGDLQGQRAAGVIVPDLDRVDAMPVRALAARQQEIDRGGAARGRWRRTRGSRNVSR